MGYFIFPEALKIREAAFAASLSQKENNRPGGYL
jgi:hypothetical protein